MPRAQLTVDLPEGSWIREVSTAFPETRFRVASALLDAERGIALLELDTPDLVSLLSRIERAEEVVTVELLWTRETDALVEVETSDPRLLGPVQQAGIPLETPFDIVDGRATWSITTTTDRLTAFRTALEDAGVSFTLETVTDIETTPADRLLTDRQREVMIAAREAGYYDDPRTATLTAVADDLDVSNATVSDVLHRAESRLVGWFLDEH